MTSVQRWHAACSAAARTQIAHISNLCKNNLIDCVEILEISFHTFLTKPHFYSTGSEHYYLNFVLANVKVFVKVFKAIIDRHM